MLRSVPTKWWNANPENVPVKLKIKNVYIIYHIETECE